MCGMMGRYIAVGLALWLWPVGAAGEPVAGDAERGGKVFRKCVACHRVGDDAKNAIWPHLNGILGRAVASLEGYKYSKALRDYAVAQPVWTYEMLDGYLAAPRGAVKGTRMNFVGLRKEKDRRDVIAYLRATAP